MHTRSGMTMSIEAFLSSLPPALSMRGGSGVTTRQLAARIREELALAVAAGVLPPGTRFGVRSRSSGFTGAVDVEITAWEGTCFSDEYMTACLDAYTGGREPRWDRRECERFSDAFLAARRAVERIAGRHNFDESDSMTDYYHVGYYLHVEARAVESAWLEGMRCEVQPAYADLVHRARAAAAALPKALVRYLVGSRGMDGIGEHTARELLKWGERAQRGPIVHTPGLGWHVASAV